jgi:hypothetical protein
VQHVKLVNVPCEETLSQDQLAARCILEYEKIKRYADKGDIEKRIVPEEVEEA